MRCIRTFAVRTDSQLQVFRPVIVAHTVTVVHLFIRKQRATQASRND